MGEGKGGGGANGSENERQIFGGSFGLIFFVE